MTEEDPIRDKDKYEFPSQHFNKLREYDVGSPYYMILQGSIYEQMRYVRDDFTEMDAINVNRLLQNGQVDEAEETVESILGDE